ncbi:MAG: hypothetical protein GY920_19440 [Aliivibrio sp.]|nr:hypothetical protein [Aliivibrio sp.]
MKNAITFQSGTHSHLLYTARKKKNHYELISVQTGAVLIRLGKWEYLVLPGELFWIPFDALSSMTIIPNSTLSTLMFSIRTREALPTQGGYITSTPLLSAGFDKLQAIAMTENAKQHLLYVMQDELLEASPHTDLSPESQHINTYLSQLSENKEIKHSQVSPDMMMTLKVREADKMRKSGAKNSMIADRYFSGNTELLEQAYTLLG